MPKPKTSVAETADIVIKIIINALEQYAQKPKAFAREFERAATKLNKAAASVRARGHL